MKKIIKRCLKIMVGIVAVVALLLAVAAWLLNTDTVQNQLMQLVSEELAERLHTRVAVDHVRVDVVRQRLKVCGVSISDQQQQEMLRIEQIAAGVELLPLMHHEINITEAGVEGLKAHFYEVGEDSVPNYQFILDSLKSDKPHKADTAATPRKAKMKLNIGRVWLRQIDVTYDTHNKKGPVTLQVGLGEGDVVTRGEQYFLTLDSLLFATDNHRPRKNSGKPKRGYFDEGHLRLAAWMKVSVDYAKGDSLHAVLRQCRLSDPMTGIHVGDLRLQVGANKRQAWVSALTITWGSTNLKIDEATVQLPSKKEGTGLRRAQGNGQRDAEGHSQGFRPAAV